MGLFDPPVKIGEGWVKCLSELYDFRLGPNLWYTFDGASLGQMSGRLERECQKKDKGKTSCSTIVRVDLN